MAQRRYNCKAPVGTQWNSPITFAVKKDAQGNPTAKKPCLDPRHINNLLLEDDRYPLPLIPDIFARINGARIMSTLDLRTAFHRFPIYGPHQFKLAFTVKGIQ